jgi:FKBP-type peptidyl-prolyl cis-trans isomerase FkpA
MDNITSLQVTEGKVGTGASATNGKRVSVHYTGWLYDSKAADRHGNKFDSSRDRGEPFSFTLGARQVIAGWDQGVAGMKVGGTRTLVIPPELAYGSRGAGGAIPPNATLVFDVELLDVR